MLARLTTFNLLHSTVQAFSVGFFMHCYSHNACHPKMPSVSVKSQSLTKKRRNGHHFAYWFSCVPWFGERKSDPFLCLKLHSIFILRTMSIALIEKTTRCLVAISRAGSIRFFSVTFYSIHDHMLLRLQVFIHVSNEKRQLWGRPIEWLKLSFASCVTHETRSLGVLILCFIYNMVFVN